MPWKNQGGGPWGSGPKGPWGSGPQSPGPKPPDLEDLLRRGQDKLQTILPGGNFSGMGIALILVAALAIWGLSGFFRVQSEELGVVLRFGKHVRTVQPGLNYHLPYPIETDGVGDFLFNIQNPEGTVKAVAESAMRDVIGRSQIQPILTGARTQTEAAVLELMQKTLDSYGSGILIQQVQMQKVDPPSQVIDAFRDVQAP